MRHILGRESMGGLIAWCWLARRKRKHPQMQSKSTQRECLLRVREFRDHLLDAPPALSRHNFQTYHRCPCLLPLPPRLAYGLVCIGEGSGSCKDSRKSRPVLSQGFRYQPPSNSNPPIPIPSLPQPWPSAWRYHPSPDWSTRIRPEIVVLYHLLPRAVQNPPPERHYCMICHDEISPLRFLNARPPTRRISNSSLHTSSIWVIDIGRT